MHKKSLLSLIIMISLLLNACKINDQDKTNKKKIINIGAILPMTGSASAYGIDCKKGIELAIESQNSINDKVEYRLFVEDDKTEPTQAINAVQKLIDIGGAKYIIGTVTSSSMLAISPIAEKNKTVLLSPSASNPEITHAGEYIFRNWVSDNFEGTVMARYVYNDEHLKKAAILYLNNDYGNGLRQVFKDEYTRLGGKIVFDEGYPQNQSEFKTLLLKIKKTDANVIFMPGYYKEMANILVQSKNIDINIPFRGTVTCEEPQLVKIAGLATNDLIYTTPYYNPKSEENNTSNFTRSFQRKYHSMPGIFAGHGYDAANILIQAIEKSVHQTSAEVRDNILNTKNFIGVTGVTTFDQNGDVSKPIAIKKIIGGNFVLIKVIEPNEIK